ncbi:AGGF1 factor, partial [Crotophaga sulcirostris]|nr:AGGF1 factor [Crotophaga sulcirostris]
MASPPGGKQRVVALEAELDACREQLERTRRRLRRTERLYREAREDSEALTRQVEQLTKEIHNRKEKNTASVEVQTEDYTPWSQADYYYYGNYYSYTDTQGHASELPVQHNHGIEGTECDSTEASQTGASIPLRPDSTKVAGGGEDFIQNSQEAEDTSVPEGSLAEALRAAAEAAVSQTGFTYDENTGLYYDYSTGFYYNWENQLYYDPATGIYYYCDVESGRYQFHSRVDLQSYQTSGIQPTKDKRAKKKRKEPERITANEYKDLDMEEQKSSTSLNCVSTTDQVSSAEEEEPSNVRKKTKMDKKTQNSLTAKESLSTDSINSHSRKSTPDTTAFTDDSRTAGTGSEPEEGEITDSEREVYSSEDELISEETADSEDSEDEVTDEEKIWPPCIRVIVIRSPVLQTGSLYIITAVKPATIGREKDVGHTLEIPEAGVSKFHAEVYFDHDLQNYVLVDQGSQNGTVVNGNQILQPKIKCDPYILEHGDEVKMGETVLSFHIHPGSDTCDGCEPGQVRAHLQLDRKKESSVCPALSKEERELVRRKALKQIRVKYGLQNTEYEDNKAVKNPKYKDRAQKRREIIGSEGTFQRDDSPASVHVEISNSNKGHKMLEKMGWKKGEGLGKDGGGMKDPIQLQLRKTHAGLGTSTSTSIEDIQIIQSKNKKNWDKARERFAENFQEPKSQQDTPKITPWIRGTVE